LIKSYFNLYNYKLEHELRKSRLIRRLRRLSSNKIYLSNGEFKHTSNKIIITLYIYNKQKYNYIKIIERSYIKAFKSNIVNINKKLKLIKLNSICSLKKAKKIKDILINVLKTDKDILDINILSNYITNFYKKLIKISLKKLKIYLYYKQLLFINKSKFDFTFLQYLKKYLEKIYNKNIEFNFVNLRSFYLNSDVLTETMVLKIRKNRKKLLKYLKNIRSKVKLYKNINLYKRPNIIRNRYIDKKSLNNFILKNIKHKHITGFRLEASGRLTKRYTASRSLNKLSYKGNLLNIDSSYRGLSSIMLKGNLESNLQYTKLKSKTRIGSFGIKG
jgi:Mitochondrial ribosomal protein (VAR1)